MIIHIYSDGSTKTNPGVGAWASIILMGTEEIVITKAYEHTTNNRMELLGILEPLERMLDIAEAFEGHTIDVLVTSDSQYAVNSLSSYIFNWQLKGLLKEGTRIKNVDLMKRYTNILKRPQLGSIKFEWIRGHSENQYNNRCDRLAYGALASEIKHTDVGCPTEGVTQSV